MDGQQRELLHVIEKLRFEVEQRKIHVGDYEESLRAGVLVLVTKSIGWKRDR